MPTPRNLGTEIQGITSVLPGLSQNWFDTQQRFQPQLTQGNLGNFTTALRGNFDPAAFGAANPGWQEEFARLQGEGQLQGWTPEQFARAHAGNNQAALDPYYSGGALQLTREAYRNANPELVNYTAGLAGTMDRLNGAQPGWMDAAGYNAATAGPAPQASWSRARASTAGFSGAAGGPLLGTLERDAAGALSRMSPLESGLNRQAIELVDAGGTLTAGEMAGAQDSARAAYADRGLLRSNRGVGAEILATDAARRGRMFENAQFASGVSSMLEQNQNARRNYALGVQGQGQQLSQFNAGQRNQNSQFNAGLRTQNSQFNAGLGAETSRFNAGLLSATNQFNAQQLNQAGQFNAGATNQSNQFNQNLRFQNNDQQWQRAMQYGGFQLAQRQDPMQLAGAMSSSQAPDYTSGLLSYGSDLNNTNFNAAAAAEIARSNRRSSLLSSGLGLIGTIGGAFLGGPAGAALGNSLFGGAGGNS